MSVDPGADSVQVRIRAPLELPLTIPGRPERATIGATGSAVVDVDSGADCALAEWNRQQTSLRRFAPRPLRP